MISVITPVWNRADLTSLFLTKSWQFCPKGGIEFILIDNGSTDGTPFLLSNWKEKTLPLNEQSPALRIITNKNNYGFSIANNQGVKIATNDMFLFLNNDVLIRGDYLTPIIAHLQAHETELTGAELLTYNTGWNTFDGQTIPYIPGWCLAMMRKTFNDLGGFDEQYSPGDYEDIDICFTATRAGHKLRALNLPLAHLSNQTGRQLPDRLTMTKEHRGLFAEKWGFSGPTD